LAIEKNDDDGTSTLKPTMLRSADDLEPITIRFDKERNVYDDVNNVPIQVGLSNADMVKQVFQQNIGLTYAELLTRCVETFKCSRYEAEKKLVPVWYAEKLIAKVGRNIEINRQL
jgi:hypothetical protein